MSVQEFSMILAGASTLPLFWLVTMGLFWIVSKLFKVVIPPVLSHLSTLMFGVFLGLAASAGTGYVIEHLMTLIPKQ